VAVARALAATHEIVDTGEMERERSRQCGRPLLPLPGGALRGVGTPRGVPGDRDHRLRGDP
jgi:hypothetical protein